MYQCPICAETLIAKRNDFGPVWACDSCHNWLISLAILRRSVEASFYDRLWQGIKTGSAEGTPCPLCSKPMTQVFMEASPDPLAFLICKFCNISWLGPQERAALTLPPEHA
jgi:ribosomal protein L37AE/L43A